MAACLVELRQRESAERLASDRDAIAAGAVATMFSPPETPEHLLALAEERARLAKQVAAAMARLTNDNRALVRACACEGESVAAAARSVGLEYHRARYSLTVAMASLGKWLKAA